MVSKAEITTNSADTLKLAAAGALVVLGLVAFYWFADQSLLMRVVGLLLVAGLASFIVYQTDLGKRTVAFFRDARTEVRKVVWPSRAETRRPRSRSSSSWSSSASFCGFSTCCWPFFSAGDRNLVGDGNALVRGSGVLGFEGTVKRSLQERIGRAGLEEKFGDILVPTEEVVEIVTGRNGVPNASSFRLRAGSHGDG